MPHLHKRQRNGAAAAASSSSAEQPAAGPSKPSTSSTAATPAHTPRLFAPFRALGHVTDHVPYAMFVHTPQGALATPTVNITTSVGKSWLMWDAARMTLVFAGPDAGAQINALAMTGTEIFASAGARVIKYHRGKETGSYLSPDQSTLGKILIFGDELLVLKEDGTGMLVYDLSSKQLRNQITFHTSFTATQIMHPSTYLNKVLVGSQQGELQLWNVRTCSLIHTFPHPTPTSPSPVTTIVQSPAIDVVGVGYLDGSIRVLDIKHGDLVMQMKIEDGSVAGLAFRMDGPPILASASSTGSLATWDLSKGGRVLHVVRGSHDQSVTGLQWVAGQPLLISSSADNSVKQWLCDSPTANPRILKFRGGHHAPPTCIRYYGEDGKQILTAGRDRSLRYTSVVRDSRSFELSQGSLIKKAIGLGVTVDHLKYPQITSISSSSIRSKDWEDVVTAHADDAVARTWRVQEKRLGPWAFEVEDGIVQTVCVTACGNFALVGSSTGEIRMWNLQSGKERRSFSMTAKADGEKSKKSIQAVTGLVTDALNRTVVASTLEGKIYFFDFHTTALVHAVQLSTSITTLSLNRDSGLLAITCDDLVVRLLDVETRRIVRELRGFKGRILDVVFSPDSRWLIATSLDSTIRTFDIPTGRLVDAFRTASIATSLTFSPTGDFLATAHVDSVGIHLWANKAQFTDVALRHLPEEEDVPEVGLPSVQGLDEDAAIEGIEAIGAPEFTDIYTTPDQLTEGLLTLSLMPRSRWQTLLNLETIKQRNKPKEAPKAPEAAPFFLPTISGLETKFDLSAANGQKDDGDASKSQRLDLGSGWLESEFTKRLTREDEDGEYNAFFEYLKSLPPSTLDMELRSLLSLDHLSSFLSALIGRLRSHRDFEAVQAIMNVFLSVHGDLLIANEELSEKVRLLRDEQGRESKRLRELVGYSLGTLGFLRGT
ncbi:U3 small nucleolar RNA-associated protein 21 [Kwoniella heveanensis BCC8398]|uniref:U3 small nucleolar RNA-associated protein 21 n=1 Tax=Kwoniella heveanensis BCC8398 TaxID=1296120 RepID=A0A1B9GRM1_9TREE|nr:U3 small nucleolar RNA-associated protein 21 [Kwoniella heveanensis BCC8398]